MFSRNLIILYHVKPMVTLKVNQIIFFFFSCHMVKKIHFQIKFYRFPVWAMQWMGELEQFSTSLRWSTGSTNLVDWHR